MGIVSSEELARRRREREEHTTAWFESLEQKKRAAARPSPATPAEFAEQAAAILREGLAELRPEMENVVRLIQERQGEQKQEQEEEPTRTEEIEEMADNNIVLSREEQELIEAFRRRKLEQQATEAATASREAQDQATATLASVAMEKRPDQLTDAERAALRSETQAVLRELGWTA